MRSLFLLLSLLTAQNSSFAGDALLGLAKSCAQNAWRDPKVLESRLAKVIAHQNEIRRIPDRQIFPEKMKTIEEDAQISVYVEAQGTINYDNATTPHFTVREGLLMRGVYNDIFAYNFVYEFEGDQIKRTTPYAKWVLEQRPEELVTLYRTVVGQTYREKELKNIKSDQVEETGRDWGFEGPGWEPETKVLHYSLDKVYIPHNGSATYVVQISKRDLLELANRDRVRSGWLEYGCDELVIPSVELARLAREGKANFLFDGPLLKGK